MTPPATGSKLVDFSLDFLMTVPGVDIMQKDRLFGPPTLNKKPKLLADFSTGVYSSQNLNFGPQPKKNEATF